MDRFINALGIRHVGETNARLIARHYPRHRRVHRCDGEQGTAPSRNLQEIGGIGDVVAQAIKDFFDEPHNRKHVDHLLKEVEVVPLAAPKTSGSPVIGQTVVFTGTLEKMTRQEAKARAESLGAEGFGLGVEEDRPRRRGPRRRFQADRRPEIRCRGDPTRTDGWKLIGG